MTVFVKKLCFSKQKLLFFKIVRFTFFAVSWSIFKLFRPILPFWNSQSLIYNILLFEKYAMNNMTEIEINMCLLFLLSVSK